MPHFSGRVLKKFLNKQKRENIMKNLKNNFVFILGGSSGIGRAILEKLAAELESSTIVFTWRRKSALEKIDLKSLVRNENKVIPQELDTAKDFEEIEELEDLT
jgi:NADP-dependent 3-hydroxy acid dehydrogenase YdfG